MLFRERQQLTICVVAGVVVCVFMLFWYLPLHKKMKAIRQAKTAQSLAIAKGGADSKQLPLMKEQLLELQARLGDYEANIPEQNTFGGFLGRIADLMNENNLQEQEITPGEEVKADQFNCIPVSMHCKGKLVQIFKLYRQLQRLDRLIRIEQVKLFNDTGYNGRVSMETKAIIYYRAKVG
ncbi:MAG: type 4a pilus biogenesis protein PilO [Sedimentisphaerales bacterium]